MAETLVLKPGLVKDMFYSPERDESEASLHIDRSKNVWYDHGSGKGGTNADLVMLVKHCSRHEAYEFLRSLEPGITRWSNYYRYKNAVTFDSVNGRRMP